MRPELRESLADLVVRLCSVLAAMQESGFECLPFDPFALFQNGFVSAQVDVAGVTLSRLSC